MVSISSIPNSSIVKVEATTTSTHGLKVAAWLMFLHFCLLIANEGFASLHLAAVVASTLHAFCWSLNLCDSCRASFNGSLMLNDLRRCRSFYHWGIV